MIPAENPAEPDDSDAEPGSATPKNTKGRAIARYLSPPPGPVDYTGTVADHEVRVEIRHGVVDTTLARMWVDGEPALQESENDAALKKTRKRLAALDEAEAKEGALSAQDQQRRRLDEDSFDHPWHGVFDAKYFSFKPSPADADSETETEPDDSGDKPISIKVKLRTLGKTAEVTTAMTTRPQFLVPTPGSDSAARDRKQLANPRKFALRSAALKAVAILIGLGAAWLAGHLVSWLVRLIRPLLPDISLPSINIPTPDISLPSINLPSIDLPSLPAWVEHVEPFIQPLVLILIAGTFALVFAKRKQKALAEREEHEEREDDSEPKPEE